MIKVFKATAFVLSLPLLGVLILLSYLLLSGQIGLVMPMTVASPDSQWEVRLYGDDMKVTNRRHARTVAPHGYFSKDNLSLNLVVWCSDSKRFICFYTYSEVSAFEYQAFVVSDTPTLSVEFTEVDPYRKDV